MEFEQSSCNLAQGAGYTDDSHIGADKCAISIPLTYPSNSALTDASVSTCTSITADSSDENTLMLELNCSSGGNHLDDRSCDDTNDCDMVADQLQPSSVCTSSTTESLNDYVGDEEYVCGENVLTSRSGRPLRRCRQDSETTIVCPICKQMLRLTESDAHIQIEISKLSKISSRHRKTVSGTDQASPRKKTFLRIQKNRHARQRSRMRGAEFENDNTTCPVCSAPIDGTPEELNEHVELCLSRVQRTDEDQDVDVDHSDDEFEEYEWAGQTRVRASSMLMRDPLTSASAAVTQVDDATDLDIEDDDSVTYGCAQYTEGDLLLLGSDESGEDKNKNLLRNAVLGGQSTISRLPPEGEKWNCSVSGSDNSSQSPLPTPQPSTSTHCSNSSNPSRSMVLLSLQSKISELEQQLKSVDIPRCLICMETYTRPLVSIQCWHVHCEECWLRTLGAKKLCPQCNVITSPLHLRRIFL